MIISSLLDLIRLTGGAAERAEFYFFLQLYFILKMNRDGEWMVIDRNYLLFDS